MELQEDAYRLQQVLENVDYKDIIKFLRTKVALADTEIRCQIALQHFLNLEEDLAKKEETFDEYEIKADFLCIKHLLKSVPDEEIKELLTALGPISNRKYVAVKLLIRTYFQPSSRKKRKNYDKPDDICEASSSKLVKITDLNGTFESVNGTENLKPSDDLAAKKEPLKLTIKSVKDRNGNDKFMVTSPNNTRSGPKICQSEAQDVSTTTPEVIEISDQEDKIVFSPLPSNHIVNTALLEPATESLPTDCPSIRMFQNGSKGFLKPISDVEPSTSKITEMDTVPFTTQVKEVEEEEGDLSSDSLLQDSNEVEILDAHVNSTQNSEKGIDLSLAPRFIDEKLVLKLIEMFPEASPDYIRNVCEGKEWSERNFDEIVTVILSAEEYPKRPERLPSPPKEVDPEEQLNMLKEVFPDADPSYLHEKIDQLAGDQDALRGFIEDAMENKQYPTLKEYLRKQQLSAQQRQYTTEFDVERFVELFPDPVSTFEDHNRKTTILDQTDKCYVKWFMRNKYNQLYAKDVNHIVENEGSKNIVSIVKTLNGCLARGSLKKTRWIAHSRPDTQNIPLLQELAYFEHIDEIYSHIENKKTQAAQERQNAKELGLLQSCACCYDEEVMPNDILTCSGGCRFCRDCIKKGTEIAFGEGKVVFPCLMDCGAEFSLQVLQNVLPPKVFSKLAQKKAVAEVKAAGIEDLETCPFCDFATIPPPEDRLFRCLNQDCMKESCRLCKEPSHVPLRCDEVEKDEDVKARTYIEDKMTEALIRQCWKCDAKFFKEEGCNKMTCSCGAIMCYVCRKPVKDYKHFNGQGGSRHDLCPLYTDNFVVNEKNVLEAAEEAKKQIDPAQLKNDPTADLEKHFADKIKQAEQRAKLYPNGAHVRGLPIEQYQQVQRLRRELRDQLRLIGDFNMHDRQQVMQGLGPHMNQMLAGYRRPQPPPPAHQPPQQVPRPVHDIRAVANPHLGENQNIGLARLLGPPINPMLPGFRPPQQYAAALPGQAPQHHPENINHG